MILQIENPKEATKKLLEPVTCQKIKLEYYLHTIYKNKFKMD